MTTFLNTVARAYADRYRDLSEFCFVFPNKRAGTFFLKNLSACASESPMLAPKVISIADMAEELSDRVVNSRVDLIFRLYLGYCRLKGFSNEEVAAATAKDSGCHHATPRSPEENRDMIPDFDDFRSWGEIALSDFGEVDMYMVPPSEIFKNLKDFRGIAANYLTEEQRRVMTEYFGYAPDVDKGVERFWKNFVPEEALSDARKSFLYLWQVLGPLYNELESDLEKAGLCTPAGAFRLALERLRDNEDSTTALEEILPWKKMVFVGFNALSMVERELFIFFRDSRPRLPQRDGEEETFADFLWDGTGPVLSPAPDTPEDSEMHNIAGAAKFLNLNRRDFPSPPWTEPYTRLSDRDTLPPHLKIVASPSNSYQAKLVGSQLREWYPESVATEEIEEAKVAVVLPDENLLLPMVYSLPEWINNVNLTMGYPLRLTSTMSLVTIYRYAQRHVRRTAGGPAFYHRDLRALLGHPLVVAAAGAAETRRLLGWMETTHTHAVTSTMIGALAPVVARLLRPLAPDAGVEAAHANLYSTLSILRNILEEQAFSTSGIVKGHIDRDHIDIYLAALDRLHSAVKEHGVSMLPDSYFILADRMLAGEQVEFEGEPLRGLQIMGVLETRALDFDRLIIPSANERMLPVAGRTRSFIPNSLRAGYRMPPMQHQETLSAYYFYRLISRAKEVVLLYDARAGAGTRSNDISRYILQLQYLHARGHLEIENVNFSLKLDRKPLMEIEKVDYVAQQLRAMLAPEGTRRLSLTTFQTYLQCGLKFFYETVMGIRTDEVPSDYITPAQQGSVVHAVMEDLYSPAPIDISQARLRALINDCEEPIIERRVREKINRLHYNRPPEEAQAELGGAAEMAVKPLTGWIKNILRRDLASLETSGPGATLRIEGIELREDLPYPLGDGREVNFRMVVDRLQKPFASQAPGEAESLVMIDYKTGSVHTEVESMEALMDGSHLSKIPLQLMLYSELFNHYRVTRLGEPAIDVEPLIYNIPEILDEKKFRHPLLRYAGKKKGGVLGLVVAGEEVGSALGLSGEFRELLQAKLRELFNLQKPFRAPEDESHCSLCALKMLCGR